MRRCYATGGILMVAVLYAAVFCMAGSYPPITGPCALSFPEDHGAHPEYRTEWWYYTGNVATETGHSYGYQLTFFRSRVTESVHDSGWPDHSSPWRTGQIYMAHAALTDIQSGIHHHSELTGRGAMGIAGVSQAGDMTRVFLNSWSAVLEPEKHVLRSCGDEFSMELTLIPEKSPVLHGNAGYSRKGEAGESASCYYSITRLKTTGRIMVGDKPFSVEGSSWMDHEFSSAPLEPDLEGWDWFSLQFADNTECMVYLMRQRQGSYSPASAGTVVDSLGNVTHLTAGDISVRVLDTWKSPNTGARYPSKWVLEVLPEDLHVTLETPVPDQEMVTSASTDVTYWEGCVTAAGTRRGRPVSGKGYVELTGYDRPFDAPM